MVGRLVRGRFVLVHAAYFVSGNGPNLLFPTLFRHHQSLWTDPCHARGHGTIAQSNVFLKIT